LIIVIKYVVLAFQHCDKIPGKTDLKGGKIYFSLQFQKFQSIVGPLALGPMVRPNIMKVGVCGGGGPCLLTTRKQKEMEEEVGITI
jgi:hypothetical protein